MTGYWSTCHGCTYCSIEGCPEVAYCDNEPHHHHGPAYCDQHTPSGNAA